MTNPQKTLYKMLAESSLRGAHAAKVHESRVQQIPTQQQSMLEEIEHLRSEIQTAGVGNNVEAEDRYMELLEDFNILQDSWDMHQLRKSPQSDSGEEEQIEEEMAKAISYGSMLVSVYGGGALAKGAGEDLGHWALFLAELPYARARKVSRQLQEILKNGHQNRTVS